MKIIDKNMLKAAKRKLENSREVYPYEKNNGEVILFSNHPIDSVERRNHMYDTSMYDEQGNVKHPNVVLLSIDENYQDYRFTDMIYQYVGTDNTATVEIIIPFAHSLSSIQAKYSSIFVSERGQWVELETTYDRKSKLLIATYTTNQSSFNFAVFSNYFWYSCYTKRLAENFPTWSFIYKNRESNGQCFLNAFGIAFEELEEHFNWINEQHFIYTTDLTQLDWIYAYTNTKEMLHESDKFYIKGDVRKQIKEIYDVKEFTHNDMNEGIIVDYKKSIIYSQYDYPSLIVEKVDGRTFEVTQTYHHIWNTFDEFGMLLGVKRHYKEKNYRFIERILDVFRYPANSSEMGLTHGIARELDMIERYTTNKAGEEIELEWKDDTKPLMIRNKSGMMLDHRTLRIDGRKISLGTQYDVDHNNNIIIKPLNEFITHQISIVRGIEKYELHNKEDEKLFQLMYRENGLATPLLESWVAYIRKIAPVMWDDFQWDKGYWDTIDKDLTGVGYVPNHWDSSIDAWKGKMIYE